MLRAFGVMTRHYIRILVISSSNCDNPASMYQKIYIINAQRKNIG